MTGAYAGTGAQHLDFDTTQEHAAEHTTSDLAFRGVLSDRATAVWRGMIRVDPGAQQTDAFQESRNLLLSTRAHADAIPGLEIEANDVRCTHAAAVAQVDREQLYYLRSRGLPESQAKRLVIDGFLQELAERTLRAPSGTACPPRSTVGSPRSWASCPAVQAGDHRPPMGIRATSMCDAATTSGKSPVFDALNSRVTGWPARRRHVDAQAERLKELGLVRDDPQAHLVPFSVLEAGGPLGGGAPPITRTVATGGCGLLRATRMGLAPAMLPARSPWLIPRSTERPRSARCRRIRTRRRLRRPEDPQDDSEYPVGPPHVRTTPNGERRARASPLDAVEQAPVRPKRGLRCRHQPILLGVVGELGRGARGRRPRARRRGARGGGSTRWPRRPRSRSARSVPWRLIREISG